MEALEVFIPSDRRRAIAVGQPLPDRAYGTVLFADISGSTPLTDALVKELGPRQGIDELTQQLNRVYDAMIATVERFQGSVVCFSGDAITCWFDNEADSVVESAPKERSSLRAVACALQMQQVMLPFYAAATPSGVTVSLAIKIAVTTGPVRRFLVGDPKIQYLDVLAGQTLDRMARIEKQARKGEILVGPEVVAHLGDSAWVAEWRAGDEAKAEPGERFAVIDHLTPAAASAFDTGPAPAPLPPLSETQSRAWLFPPVYERLQAGGRFLAELRTAVALFLSFEGLDYDRDNNAGHKLDRYIRWVQNCLVRYDGNLLQLTIGDKGSYMYISFGAPLAHGDDVQRAVTTALALQNPPAALDFIIHPRIGLSQGRMRVGAYGSQTRRTYGVLGSEANVAARLMSKAQPGQILASKHVAQAAAKTFQFTYLETGQIKGRADPMPIFEVAGRREPPQPRPLVPAEYTALTQLLDAVLAGQGQVVRLAGAPGIAQVSLTNELVEQASRRDFQIARQSCQSPKPDALYSPWREIFRNWFDLSDGPPSGEARPAWLDQQIQQVKAILADINPDWLPLLPLLGDLLGLPVADNETTGMFNPLLRQGTLYALVLEMIKTWAASQPSLIIIEEAQWLNAASQRLTLALARTVAPVPLLLALVHSPAETLLPELDLLSYYHQFPQPPASPPPPAQEPKPDSPPAAPGVIGRSVERMRLTGQLQALVAGGAGGTVLVEGEAGIGKSRLVADLLAQAQLYGIPCLLGGGDAIEQSTPYHAWRPLFQQLFNLDAAANANTVGRRAQVLSVLPASPELLRLVPLLNAVLPLGLQENELTRQMTGQARADNTRGLLLNLLQRFTAQAPALLILEDAQWLDSASWALARMVSQHVQRVLFIIVSRPPNEPPLPEYSQLLQSPQVSRLKLEALSADETLALICQRLGVKTLPDPVAALIRAKAEGHPFFSEELAYALRDAGLIRIEGDTCQLTTEAAAFSQLMLPNTVEEVITSRIDRLSPAQQLILKIASVIGRTFSMELLRNIHPNQAEKPYLPAHLNTLTHLDILDRPEPDAAYTFKHGITREVAYNLMLFDQRQELHRAVAEWFERTYANDLLPFYALLAHHWSQAIGAWRGGAVSVGKALDYLEKAGEQALHSNANQEAVRFFGQALTIAESHLAGEQGTVPATMNNGDSPDFLRRSRWERQLGEAYLGLGQLAESRQHLIRAAVLLGWPQPAQRGSQAAALLGQVLQQLLHSVWPAHRRLAPPTQRIILLEAARIYERLGEIYYWSNETLPAIYAAVRTLNLAQQTGPSPELARAYANVSLVAGFASLRNLAERYSRRAQTTALHAQHQPALAWVLELTGVYAIGVGQWAKASDTLQQAALLAHQLEDRRRREECLTALSDVSFFQGKFAESLKLWPDIYASARQRGDAQAQSWGLAGQLRSLLALGELDTNALEALLLKLESVAREDIGSADKINAYGIMALVRWRLGQTEAAQAALEVALQWIDQSSPTGYGIIHGYHNTAEVCLALWEAETNMGLQNPELAASAPGESLSLKASAGQICHVLRRYARAFPIGQPRAWRWQGLYHALSGQPGQAQTCWRKSVAAAERLEMPYEQAQAFYELGRHLPSGHPNRQLYLNQAMLIFNRLNVQYDLGA